MCANTETRLSVYFILYLYLYFSTFSAVNIVSVWQRYMCADTETVGPSLVPSLNLHICVFHSVFVFLYFFSCKYSGCLAVLYVCRYRDPHISAFHTVFVFLYFSTFSAVNIVAVWQLYMCADTETGAPWEPSDVCETLRTFIFFSLHYLQ